MNDLTVFQENGKLLTDSREVAQMLSLIHISPSHILILALPTDCPWIKRAMLPSRVSAAEPAM